jgi:hypothetical protein
MIGVRLQRIIQNKSISSVSKEARGLAVIPWQRTIIHLYGV